MTSPASPAALRGIWPALLTPLRADLSIDHDRFAAHARSLVERGCGGVTPFGTTGEGPSFTVAERRAAVDALVAGRVPAACILVSTSCAALPDALELTRHAVSIGAWGCLLMPPFFLKGVSDQGVIDSYRYVIDGVADARLRIMLYHIPQISGVALSRDVIGTLQRLYPGTIVGIKDSGGQIAHSGALAAAFMPPLGVHVGHEPDLPALARRGSGGAVRGLATLMPRLVGRLVSEPDSPRAVADLARVNRLLGWLGGYALTPALKAIMAAQSGDSAWLRVRPPLVALDAAAFATFQRELPAFAIDPEAD